MNSTRDIQTAVWKPDFQTERSFAKNILGFSIQFTAIGKYAALTINRAYYPKMWKSKNPFDICECTPSAF